MGRQRVGLLQLRVLRRAQPGAPAGALFGPIEPLRSYNHLAKWLEKLRPPNHLALEAVGTTAMLKALKALAKSGPLREPARFVPMHLEVEGERRSNEGRNGGALRGIRFLVAPASAADDPWGAWSSLPPLRVAAKTDVVRLARALLLERKMRSRKMPILLEATCSRRHAYIVCKALAKAQQLSMLLVY